MTLLTQHKTSFTAGEIDPKLLGRGDLKAFENGAATLQNVVIQPTGGVQRRAGLYYVDTLPWADSFAGRLISFEFNTEQTYLIVLTNSRLDVYKAGIHVATLTTPWWGETLRQITWTQSADTLLLCHPNVAPKKLVRLSDSLWQLQEWVFYKDENTNVIMQPHYKFAADDVKLTPSATSGTITLTASAPLFVTGHMGTRFRIAGKEVEITAITSATIATALVIQTLSNTSATANWVEQSFSAVRGWPQCAVFHQDRLVIGGSRDLPNRLWLSRTSNLWHFDKGTGLDDEAIEFAVLSDQVNAIRALFSGRHLQVFTSGAEWVVSGDPLTPLNVQLKRQTRIGSLTNYYVPPVDVDGATLFVGATGRELRQFIYTDLEQAYQANDLALLARHMFDTPIDQAFDQKQRVLFAVLDNGDVAALTLYRAESVVAWSRFNTAGKILATAVSGGQVYFLVQRGTQFLLERLDNDVLADSALMGQSTNPVKLWQGLDHLEGQTVAIVADGMVHENQVVVGGAITLHFAARNVQVGLSYTHIIKPLPPNHYALGGLGQKIRLMEAVFRLHNTQALTLDIGRGLKDVALRVLGQTPILDSPPPTISGDYKVRNLGWQQNGTDSLWRIEQTAPLPFTLLSVTMQLKVND